MEHEKAWAWQCQIHNQEKIGVGSPVNFNSIHSGIVTNVNNNNSGTVSVRFIGETQDRAGAW